MQTWEIISKGVLGDVLAAIYASGDPIVKETSAYLDVGAKVFATAHSLRKDILHNCNQKNDCRYVIYYPAAKGVLFENPTKLNPGVSKNHTHTFRQEGWGLISLFIVPQNRSSVVCMVNTTPEPRASKWREEFVLGDPTLWEWDVVQRNERRIIRPILRAVKAEKAEKKKKARKKVA
jgi:hypothetical protein